MPRLRHFKWGEWASAEFAALRAHAPEVIAVDTETSGIAFHDAAFCVTASWRDPAGGLFNAYFDLDEDEAGTRAEMVRQMLAATPTWVFHNAKFDLQKLTLLLGDRMPTPDTLHDTQVIFNLINENERKALKILAKTVLGEETNEDERLKVVRRKLKLTKDDGYHLLPREVIIPYAMKDTEFTLRLYEKLWPRFQKMVELDPPLGEVYREEIEVSEALRRMEARGFLLDMEYLQKTTDEYSIRVMEGWGRIQKISGVTDPKFPNSPKQLLAAFEKRGLALEDTTEATLSKLDDDLARELLQYRSDKKMHKTYLKGLLDEQVDGVVHPWFNPTGARTGRMSSGSASA